MKKRLILVAGAFAWLLLLVFAAGAADVTPEIPIVNTTVTGVELGAVPKKTEYYQGEALDCSGAYLNVSFSDGRTDKIQIKNSWCAGYDTSTIGEKTITVSFPDGGDPVSFKVTVNTPNILRIYIDTPPAKTDYYTGEGLDLTGMSVKALYNSGVSYDITQLVTVSGADLITEGEGKQVDVYYIAEGQRHQTYFKINVQKLEITSVTLATTPTVTTVYDGTDADYSGLSLDLTYSSGEHKYVSDVSLMQFEGFDSSKLGDCEVRVTYLEYTLSFTMTVVLSPEHIHTPGEYTVSREASCSLEGEETALCVVCGEIAASRALPLTEHLFGEWFVYKEPTTSEEGISAQTCAYCDAMNTEAIPVLPETTAPETTAPETEPPEKEDGSSALVFIGVVAVAVSAVLVFALCKKRFIK